MYWERCRFALSATHLQAWGKVYTKKMQHRKVSDTCVSADPWAQHGTRWRRPSRNHGKQLVWYQGKDEGTSQGSTKEKTLNTEKHGTPQHSGSAESTKTKHFRRRVGGATFGISEIKKKIVKYLEPKCISVCAYCACSCCQCFLEVVLLITSFCRICSTGCDIPQFVARLKSLAQKVSENIDFKLRPQAKIKLCDPIQ